MIPARNDARETPEFKESPQSALDAVVDDMRFLPTVPGVPDVQVQTLEIAVSDAILGRAKPKDALSGAADRATQLLQANLRKFKG
jgi:multiple sugar transport system substrate-binding protein